MGFNDPTCQVCNEPAKTRSQMLQILQCIKCSLFYHKKCIKKFTSTKFTCENCTNSTKYNKNSSNSNNQNTLSASKPPVASRFSSASSASLKTSTPTRPTDTVNTTSTNLTNLEGNSFDIAQSDASKNRNSIKGSSTVDYQAAHDSIASILHSALTEHSSSILTRLDSLLSPLNTIPAVELQLKRACDSLLSLEKVVHEQNSKLEEFQSRQTELMEENKYLKEKITFIHSSLNTVMNKNNEFENFAREKLHLIDMFLGEQLDNIADNFDSCKERFETLERTVAEPLAPQNASDIHKAHNSGMKKKKRKRMSKNTTNSSKASTKQQLTDGDGCCELVVSCALDSSALKMAHDDFVFAVLGTVLPALNRTQIATVRCISKPSETGAVGDSTRGASALLVTLSDGDVAKQIFKLKHKFTAFNTKDINSSLLDPGLALPAASIFINEYLHSDVYRTFKEIKSTAKQLGFKYVWHRGGRFLVRLRDGDKAFSVCSTSDLYNLSATLKTDNNERSLNKSTNININKTDKKQTNSE